MTQGTIFKKQSVIFDVEKGKLEKSEVVRAIEQVYGDGPIISYHGGDNGVYGWQDGKRKGATRRLVLEIISTSSTEKEMIARSKKLG